jgi:undecaprenyl pyrophosphate phosphatase UppP
VIADAPGWVQALVLGIVQGLTEFLLVSSSGHLVLVPALAGWERHGLAFDDPVFTAAALLLTAAMLVTGEQIHRRRHRQVTGDLDHLAGWAGVRSALAIGVAQVLALLPGVSRSGTTISAGVAAGLTRETATRFAFLLGVPAIAGAALVELPRVGDLAQGTTSELAIGVASAGVSGYLAIWLLVRLVARAGVDRFAWYLVPVAVVSFVVLA